MRMNNVLYLAGSVVDSFCIRRERKKNNDARVRQRPARPGVINHERATEIRIVIVFGGKRASSRAQPRIFRGRFVARMAFFQRPPMIGRETWNSAQTPTACLRTATIIRSLLAWILCRLHRAKFEQNTNVNKQSNVSYRVGNVGTRWKYCANWNLIWFPFLVVIAVLW